jgi:hypothetical protein
MNQDILRLAMEITKAKSSIVFFVVNLKDRAGAIKLAGRSLNVHIRVTH